MVYQEFSLRPSKHCYFLNGSVSIKPKNNWTLKMEILIWLKVLKDFMIKLNGETALNMRGFHGMN